MGEIIELKTKEKQIDDTAAKTWSPLDCLKSCIEDIESKKLTATHVYVAMIIEDGDEQRIAFTQAGMGTVFETIGILKIHTDYHATQWYSDDEE